MPGTTQAAEPGACLGSQLEAQAGDQGGDGGHHADARQVLAQAVPHALRKGEVALGLGGSPRPCMAAGCHQRHAWKGSCFLGRAANAVQASAQMHAHMQQALHRASPAPELQVLSAQETSPWVLLRSTPRASYHSAGSASLARSASSVPGSSHLSACTLTWYSRCSWSWCQVAVLHVLADVEEQGGCGGPALQQRLLHACTGSRSMLSAPG